MRHQLATVALLAGFLALPGAAWAQDDPAASPLPQKDVEFIQKAAGDGMAEVELGELAVDRAQNEEIQEFAQKMVDDHGKANDELAQIAENKEVELPDEIPPEAKAAQERLNGLEEGAFDRAYIDQMVTDHEKAVELFQQQAGSGQDPDLQNFAQMQLPVLEAHLEQAKQLQTRLSEMAGATGETDASGAATTAARTEAADDSAGEATSGATTAGAIDGSPEAAEPAAGSGADMAEATTEGSATNGSLTEGDTTAGADTEAAETEAAAGAATGTMTGSDTAETTQQAALPPSAFGSMTAEELIGRPVVNANGDEIGEVSDIVINTQDQATLAVISVGGFLGIGAKEVAVPFENLEQGEGEQVLLGSATEEQLKEMPAYEAAEGYEEYPRDQPLSQQ